MTDPALTRLGRSTAQAVHRALEAFCPGQVRVGEIEGLGSRPEPLADFPAPSVATTVTYVDGVTGGTVLVMTLAGAKRLAAATMGMEQPKAGSEQGLDELELAAVSEAVAQVMAAAAAATGELLGTAVRTSAPQTRVLRAGEPVPEDLCPPTAHATATALTVLGEPARLVQLVPSSFTARLTAALDDLGFEVGVRQEPGAAASPTLGGITMRVTAELGRARMHAGRVVGLSSGTVVELDAGVDAPLDLLVNGVPFARARLLVTEDGEWAVHIDEVVPPAADPAPGAPVAGLVPSA